MTFADVHDLIRGSMRDVLPKGMRYEWIKPVEFVFFEDDKDLFRLKWPRDFGCLHVEMKLKYELAHWHLKWDTA